MKKVLLLNAFGLLALVSQANALPVVHVMAAHSSITVLTIPAGIEVPPAAKATIARLYPGVKDVKWEKEEGNYEAGLKHNGKQLSLVIDAKGNVLETETTIAVSALPASVREYVTKHRAGKPIKEAAEIVNAKGRKLYEAEVGGKDLMFDEKGVFIK